MKTTLLTFFSFFYILLNTLAMGQSLDWAVHIGNTNMVSNDDLVIDNVGNIYAIGNFRETIDLDPGDGEFFVTSSSGRDGYVVKLDPEGNFIWGKTFRGIVDQRPDFITFDTDSNLVILGDFEGTLDADPSDEEFILDAGTTDLFFIKMNRDGELVTAKNYGLEISCTVIPEEIDRDEANNFYVVGRFDNTVDFNPLPGETELRTAVGEQDMFILKVDSDGEFVWVVTMGAESTFPGVFDVAVDQENERLLTGGGFSAEVDFDPGPDEVIRSSGDDQGHIFMLTLDLNGNFEDVTTFGSDGSNYVSKIIQNDAGEVYWIGRFSFVVDFNGDDPGGELNSGSAERNLFVLKHSAEGEFEWVRKIDLSFYSFIDDILLDDGDNLTLYGAYVNTTDFDPLEGTEIYTAETQDNFLLNLNGEDGSFEWVYTFGGDVSDAPGGLDLDGDYVLGGRFGEMVDFDLSETEYILDAEEGFDGFIFKFGDRTVGLAENQSLNKVITLYPNPSAGLVTLATETEEIMSFRIYTVSGRLLLENEPTSSVMTLDLNEYPKGMYVVEIEHKGGEIQREKLIIQ